MTSTLHFRTPEPMDCADPAIPADMAARRLTSHVRSPAEAPGQSPLPHRREMILNRADLRCISALGSRRG
jgi:hypothetical protein